MGAAAACRAVEEEEPITLDGANALAGAGRCIYVRVLAVSATRLDEKAADRKRPTFAKPSRQRESCFGGARSAFLLLLAAGDSGDPS